MSTTTKKISGFQFDIRNRNHSVMSDVTAVNGGTDRGMTPHELLESALAACTAITVTMYADRKKWPLKDVDVQVKVTKEGPQSEIERQIHFVGDLSQEQHLRLVEIANKCPLHNLLESQIKITTTEN